MTLITDCLTSHAEMERLFSAAGMVAFSDHEKSGIQDDDVVDDCANQGSAEVFNYACQRYSTTALASHTTPRGWATLFACILLAIRRGNEIPEPWIAERERIMPMLEGTGKGTYQFYGLALRADLRPTWSNLQVDRRHRHSTVRVTQVNSSDAPTVLTQDKLQEVPPVND